MNMVPIGEDELSQERARVVMLLEDLAVKASAIADGIKASPDTPPGVDAMILMSATFSMCSMRLARLDYMLFNVRYAQVVSSYKADEQATQPEIEEAP